MMRMLCVFKQSSYSYIRQSAKLNFSISSLHSSGAYELVPECLRRKKFQTLWLISKKNGLTSPFILIPLVYYMDSHVYINEKSVFLLDDNEPRFMIGEKVRLLVLRR